MTAVRIINLLTGLVSLYCGIMGMNLVLLAISFHMADSKTVLLTLLSSVNILLGIRFVKRAVK